MLVDEEVSWLKVDCNSIYNNNDTECAKFWRIVCITYFMNHKLSNRWYNKTLDFMNNIATCSSLQTIVSLWTVMMIMFKLAK